jgi:hypothetical protein
MSIAGDQVFMRPASTSVSSDLIHIRFEIMTAGKFWEKVVAVSPVSPCALDKHHHVTVEAIDGNKACHVFRYQRFSSLVLSWNLKKTMMSLTFLSAADFKRWAKINRTDVTVYDYMHACQTVQQHS